MEQLEQLYEKKVKCPVCGNNFKSSKVKSSKLRIEKRDSDFFTYYKCENPIKYSVFVCPECGYSAMEDKFDSLNKEGKEIIREKVTPKWRKREYSGIRTILQAVECYKLALYCGQLLNFKKYDIGNICLRLAWLYRMMESEEEIKFLKYTLEMFTDAFYNEDISEGSFDELSLSYLIGELYRRIGEEKEAVIWLSKTLSNPLIKSNPRIEKITREQWYIVKGKERNGG